MSFRLLDRILVWGAMALSWNCSPSLEDAFTEGKSRSPCIQSINACPSKFASCVLDNNIYAEVNFPGDFRFLVDTEANSDVEVQLFFAEQRDPGVSTQIFWYEPGCSDRFDYDSDGFDLFGLAGKELLFTEEKSLRDEGEHLIELFSDMQARVLVGVSISAPILLR